MGHDEFSDYAQKPIAPDEFSESPETFAPPPKKPRGCLFYGCLISAILIVLTIVAVGVGAYMLYRFGINTVKEYTETQPMDLPPVVMPEAHRQELRERIETFHKSLEEKKGAEPIVLTADDVNAWIEDQPKLKGHARVSIKGDQITAKVSFPLREFVGFAELANRYFNGSATLRVTLLNGILDVRADSLEVRGKPLPEAFAQSLKNKNMAEDYMKNPESREALDRLESIVVKDGTIIITPRRAKAEASPPKDDSDAEKPEAAKPDTAKASDDEKPKPEKDEEEPKTEKEPEAPKPDAPAEPKAA